jgi:eukaryotic-like serine/threonine-protein kinase
MFCPTCHREYEAGSPACPLDGTALLDAPRVDQIKTRPTGQNGAILGKRYQIRGFIGKGAMARVYLAEDLQENRPVAIKMLDSDNAREPVARERFLREARAAATIGHPNIVRVFDTGQRADGSPYLVLEFLFGESLGDLLRRDHAIEEEFGVALMRQAASALGAAHRVPITHRDVKPDNLFLVGERGNPYGLKVLDFGLAKLQEAALTQVGMAVGTIEYMAPEQVLTDPVDGRTDVYALGVVMYRMFTGALPFDQVDDAVLLAHHLLVPPPRPTEVAPALAPALEAVILTALRKDPRNRYPTMDVLLEDLERVAGERPGPLFAEGKAPAADVYVARGPLALTAAPFFYRQLGLPPPPVHKIR